MSTPGHSRGHQSLLVKLDSGRTVFLLADATYLLAKMRERALPGVLWSPDAMVASWERIEALEREHDAMLIATHDLDYRERIKLAPDGLVRVSPSEKERVLELTRRYVAPHRVDVWDAFGTQLVIGRREGYRLWDLDGRELIDLHLNGGTFNLGHRHPDVVEAMVTAAATLDVGNHHFASLARAELRRAVGGAHARRAYVHGVRVRG